MENNRPRVAVNVFVLRNNQLLLGKRKNTAGDGFWGLLGGHVEYKESLEETAKRELKEEIGIVPISLKFLHIVNDYRTEDKFHYVHFDFLVDDFKGEPQLLEPEKCYEWRWFDLHALPPESEIFIGHRKLIPAFFKKEIFVD